MFEGATSEGTRVGSDCTERQQPLDHAANVELTGMHMQLDHILAGERGRSRHQNNQRILVLNLTRL